MNLFVAGISAMPLSLLCSMLYTEDLLHEFISAQLTWKLISIGLIILCTFYFICWLFTVKKLKENKKCLGIFLLSVLPAFLLYSDVLPYIKIENGIWSITPVVFFEDISVHYEFFHQICQGLLYLAIAFFAFKVYKNIIWKTFLAKTIWSAVCSYEIYNFGEFLFYKIGIGLSTVESMQIAPNLSQADRTFGWEGHYLPMIICAVIYAYMVCHNLIVSCLIKGLKTERPEEGKIQFHVKSPNSLASLFISLYSKSKIHTCVTINGLTYYIKKKGASRWKLIKEKKDVSQYKTKNVPYNESFANGLEKLENSDVNIYKCACYEIFKNLTLEHYATTPLKLMHKKV